MRQSVAADYSYLHLRLYAKNHDELTWRMSIQEAVNSYGGIFLSCIPLDILHITEATNSKLATIEVIPTNQQQETNINTTKIDNEGKFLQYSDAFIRISNKNLKLFRAALSGCTLNSNQEFGLQIIGVADFLSSLIALRNQV